MKASLAPRIAAAIDDGATIVTPNNRLARRLIAMHDDARRADGRRTWPAAPIVPWHPWLAQLWAGHAECAVDALTLFSDAQSSHLWRQSVAADTASSAPLVDAHGAAALAQQAWTIVHAHGAGGESWRGFESQGDDEAAFVRWADHYASMLARLGADDCARIADRLSRAASLDVGGRTFVLAGFVELDAQQRRLVDALAAAGARVEQAEALLPAAARTVRVAARSARDELVAALEWARAKAAADPQATIGIAIDDLAARRDEVIALADDVLCPRLQWPGYELIARPYNVSFGVALADVPLVSTALELIAIAHAPVAIDRAAMLARSPYLAGASALWGQRAAIERRWLDDGRRAIDRAGLAGALSRDPALGSRWSAARLRPMPTRRALPRAFADAWRAWLADAGWPGDRPLASAEFQAREAFDRLVAAFVSLAAVSAEIAPAQAVDALRALAAQTLFQPQSPRAPIEIVGLLEAAGLPLDALWIVGLSSQRWPHAPRPHPLLPIAWQRERDVAHATAQRELAYAKALTGQLARGAPEVVASHARVVDDHECIASALIADWNDGGVIEPGRRSMRAQYDARPALERIGVDRAPPLRTDEPVRGGANVIEAQSECPFRAVAKHRLRAQPWEASPPGLVAWERGRLVHLALAAFWRDLRTHSALVALGADELDGRIARAVDEAMAAIEPARSRELPPIVVATEPARLAQLLREWIDACERPRPAFTVHAVESKTDVALGGITLALRLDRVDTLDDGGAAIIDYKSGEIVQLRRWFEPRPSATQLALYALAWRAAERETPLRAVAFAAVVPGGVSTRGIAADDAAWPGLAVADSLPAGAPRGWPALAAWWHERMSALARDFASGEAAVDPRELDVCKRCGLQSLCRIDIEMPANDASGDG